MSEYITCTCGGAWRPGDPERHIGSVKATHAWMDDPAATCDAESQAGGFLGKMNCVLVTGHNGPHKAKDGTIWTPMPMSSETVSPSLNEKCDVPPPGWACTRRRGHEGPCAAVPDDVVGGPPCASLPRTHYTRELDARIAEISFVNDDRAKVIAALKDVYWEAWDASKRAAKEEWHEAIEETDKSRAFRVVDSLVGDHVISGHGRKEVEARFLVALGEARALGRLQAYKSPPTVFLDELEKHRSRVNVHRASGSGSGAQNDVLEALWFLLAVAHQP